ncbi:PIR protein [Plasmodium vivax]|uniref:VIR protein n=1 Tax=Plasmodium vivax TaxID=5855 RepID=A0A565A5V6_PLAVI|nr:PIR protein [Plasmodium vivax]
MGNPCKGHNGDYFNHDCYSKLKYYFDNRCPMTDGGREYLADSIKALQSKGITTSPYNNIFEEITRLFGGDHAFSQYGNIPTCIYINYLINKNIREKSNSLYNEKSFEIFKEFDYNYSKIRFNNQINSCKSYMRLLNTDEYHRMDMLYLLYSYYDQLGSSNLQNKPNERCTYVGLLAKHYRNILGSPEDYKDMFSQLESLKKLIEKKELEFELKCSSTFKMITLTKEDPPNSEGLPGQKDNRESLPVASATDESGVSGKSADRMIITDRAILPQPSNTEATELNSSRNPVTEVTTENHHLVTAQEAAHYVERTPEEEVHGETQHVQYPSLPEARFRAQRVQEPYNTLNMFSYQGPQQVDIHTPPEKSMSPTSQSEDVGVMTNIQNAFSSIVQNVDPAPVLGVSGGMGVLFILFKYTPFGSFFGGRRGRIRQIPSSFRGFPPGEFPNFQEYDSGFIGYAPMNINPFAE